MDEETSEAQRLAECVDVASFQRMLETIEASFAHLEPSAKKQAWSRVLADYRSIPKPELDEAKAPQNLITLRRHAESLIEGRANR